MTDKPLHVQVAEALGWEYVPPLWSNRDGGNFWIQPNRDREFVGGTSIGPPRYDTDWSATGPLIEKYGITLLWSPNGWYALSAGDASMLMLDGASCCLPDPRQVEPPDSPLPAVCNLILALKEAGKL